MTSCHLDQYARTAYWFLAVRAVESTITINTPNEHFHGPIGLSSKGQRKTEEPYFTYKKLSIEFFITSFRINLQNISPFGRILAAAQGGIYGLKPLGRRRGKSKSKAGWLRRSVIPPAVFHQKEEYLQQCLEQTQQGYHQAQDNRKFQVVIHRLFHTPL